MQKKAIQIGVVGYCLKPIDYAEMMSVLKLAICNIAPLNDSMEYDFMEYVYENNTCEIKRFLIQNKIKHKFHMVMVIGKENLSKYIHIHHLVFYVGFNKSLYILNDDISELLNNEEIKNNPLIDGIGVTPCKVSYENLLDHIDDIMVKSYYFFFTKEKKIYKQKSKRQDGCYNEIVEKLDEPALLKKRLENYSRMGNESINIKQAMKLHNMILNKYQKHIGDEEDLNIYGFDELVRSYGDFQNMIQNLLLVIEDCSHKKELIYESYNKNFLKVITYINTHFTQNISIKDIAEELFLNPNYISQLFKKETGTTYVKYVNELRIEKAKELLKKNGHVH